MDKRLSIVAVEQKPLEATNPGNKASRRQTTQAKFDKLWTENPRQFDPERNCMQQERLRLTLELLQRHSSLMGKKAVDLGCGSGVFARMLAAAGAQVDALDISSCALKALKEHDQTNITAIQDLIPTTKLEDDSYDLVISTQVIGYLPREERRLYFAELSRLVKPQGFIICSTALDIDTEDALQAFGDLVETEFHPLEWVFSYHAFLIRLKYLLKQPEKFAAGYKDKTFRQQQADKRGSWSSWWYKLNSSWLFGSLWNIFRHITTPLHRQLEGNFTLMHGLEKLCRFFKSEDGISQAIFIGQRRPLIIPTKEELMAFEPKHKKQVWE